MIKIESRKSVSLIRNEMLSPYITSIRKNVVMTKKELINRTVHTLEKLPDDRIQAIADFADFMLKKYEEQSLQMGIETLVSESNSFAFLHDEEELYDDSDLKEKY